MLFPAGRTATTVRVTRLAHRRRHPARPAARRPLGWCHAAADHRGDVACSAARRAARDPAAPRARARRVRAPGAARPPARREPPAAGTRHSAGRAWSTAFRPLRVEQSATSAGPRGRGRDRRTRPAHRGRGAPGGALRARHTLTNIAPDAVPARRSRGDVPAAGRPRRDPRLHRPSRAASARRNGTGHRRHLAARVATGQARSGLGQRAGAAGTAGFSFDHGEVLTTSVAASGNSVIAVQRSAAAAATVSAGELLLPGEIVLLEGDTYTTPWVVVAASSSGLDPAAHALHTLAAQRSTPTRREQPVTLNVWEAVYFDHDQERLEQLAELGRPGRRRAVRPRRRLVPRTPRRHRRTRRLVGRRDGLAGRARRA